MDPHRVIQLIRAIVLLTCAPGLGRALHAQGGTPAFAAVRLKVHSVEGMPLSGAQVRLAGTESWLESDDRGVLELTRLRAGQVMLWVRRIGYRPDSMLVETTSGKTLDTTMTMARAAVDLALVTVVGRGSIRGPMAGFYHRQATGSGRFFTHAEIERRAPARLTDLLRGVPGVRIESRYQMNNVRMRGSRCSPSVWLDGQGLLATEFDFDAFDPLSFDGVEVYSTASVPIEFQRHQRVNSACGTIVLWTRRGEPRNPGAPKRKSGEQSPAAHIAWLLDELQVYTAADVDSVARLDSAVIVHPEYPDSLYRAKSPGSLLAEFIVGTNGVAIPESFSAVTTTHQDLVEPVRRALRTQRFVPAVRQGRTVQQVMQLPFRFVPDSTVRVRPSLTGSSHSVRFLLLSASNPSG